MVTQPGNAVEVLATRQGGSAALQAFCYTGWKLEAGSWEETSMSEHTTLRRLYAITNTHIHRRDHFVARVEAAVRGEATMVQLREKDTPRAEIVQLGRAVLDVTRRYGALLIVNDHPPIAKEIGADGV